jgi:hypothetical protein
MKSLFLRRIACFCALLFIGSMSSQAEISSVLFQDDFASNTIDPAKYQPDAPFFEGGTGDIHATAHDGVIEFVGTTTQQWWSGGTLRVAPLFNASPEASVSVSVDRVSELGVGSASRSALWILDESRTKYVLFADVRGEGGWRYNRKIGEDGDVPTGSGTDIALFNGGTYDDGALHRMKMVANGQTVKLYLDGLLGAEVKFPFSKIAVEFGSYARANNDTASTTWDNLLIENVQQTKVLLEDDFASNTTDKYTADAPFFEGGTGDIHATAHDGVIEFVGTTTQQWWSGGTLRAAPVFTPTEQTIVKASIDRVSEAGVGSASRSAFWILDETRSKYVLFADVRGEGGWRYNRKIGEDGDVPTGSGTDIALFNGASFDDGGLHHMEIIADGKTVKLMLDGQLGAEVKFPVSRVIFEFGSYARANNDTADTTWDNFKVETTVRKTTVVFQDDFASNDINPAKYQADAPFFEGGTGDIHATAHDGVIEFVGTTTQQWWSGGTLRVVPTFEASEASVLTVSVDRVAETGVGSASRSALWILDQTKTKYVLFADVRGEGGWRYNRKIGEDGDVPTGSGTDIGAFNGGSFDDGGLHHMSIIADGKTVKLLLDGIEGAEVKFPFSPVVIEFGSYARANNDTADTKWDNLVIETAGGATFAPGSLSVRVGQNSADVTVKIPSGLNSQNAVQVKVVSDNPAIAVGNGATGDTLTLTFPAGGPNIQTFKVHGVALGGAQLSLSGDVPGGNKLSVAVISGPGVLLTEDFSGATIDSNKWQVSNIPFEVGTGTYTVAQANGVLDISGAGESDFWSGASLKTKKSYVATRDLNLSVEADRVLLAPSAVGRSGIFLTTDDRSKFLFFAQNLGETGWEVNTNPGSPTGGGTSIPAFAAKVDGDSHHLRLVANGDTVEIFLDGVSGGKFPFAVTFGIYVELGVYDRATGDSVDGQFDNVKIENTIACTTFSDLGVAMTLADTGKTVNVSVPSLLHDSAPVAVTITSQNPNIAVPTGAVNGALTLTFGAGAADSQTFGVTPIGKGSTTFVVSSSPANCTAGALSVDVVAVPQVLLADDFSGSQIDPAKWTTDSTSFDVTTPGVPTAESGISIVNGQAKFDITAESSLWAGMALYSSNTYSATATAPLTFDLDRVKVEFVLTTGTGAEERTGMYVRDPNGNFVFFSEYVAHDGRNFGWRYNKVTGQADDDASGAGVNIAAFDGGTFDDQAAHHMKMVVNGATVKLYLDNVFGASVDFPSAQNLSFGFAAYADETANVTRGYFDNAKISGGEVATGGRLSAQIQGNNIVISWTGTGILEQSDTLATGSWTAVTPVPAGSSYTILKSQATAYRFYRLH